MQQSAVQFAGDIKELGGNVNDLTQYYGMAGYAQAECCWWFRWISQLMPKH